MEIADFQYGKSQAVRLPKEFRFGSDFVSIKQIGSAVVLLARFLRNVQRPLKAGFDLPDQSIYPDQVIVIETNGRLSMHRIRFQDFTLVSLTVELENEGFAVQLVRHVRRASCEGSGMDRVYRQEGQRIMEWVPRPKRFAGLEYRFGN